MPIHSKISAFVFEKCGLTQVVDIPFEFRVNNSTQIADGILRCGGFRSTRDRGVTTCRYGTPVSNSGCNPTGGGWYSSHADRGTRLAPVSLITVGAEI